MTVADPILRLVPPFLVGTLEREATADQPVEVGLSGAVLFADISGFSKLSAALFQKLGGEGIDRLVAALDHTFNPLVDAVAEHGGEVAAFAGDAAVAYWPTSASVTQADVVELAARCALTVRRRMAALPPIEGVSMQMRQIVAAGSLTAMRVGGGAHPWKVVLAGPMLDEIGPLLSAIPPGEVGVTPAAAGSRAGLSVARSTGWLVGCTDHADPARPLTGWGAPATSDEAVAYLDVTLRERLTLPGWTAESRSVTAVFLSLDAGRRPALDWLQPVVGALQETLAGRGGHLLEVIADDKGLICVCGFGLPSARPLQPQGPTLAALEVAARCAELGVEASIGLASGKAFFGCVGGRRRAAFGLTGSTLNLSARLMGQGLGVWCDAPTARAAREHVAFDEPVHRDLKGFAEPVAIRQALRPQRAHVVPVGRDAVLASFEQALARFTEGAGGGVWTLQGAAGTGRTLLLATVAPRCPGAVRVLQATAAGRGRAYAGWRPIVLAALGDPPDVRAAVDAIDPELAPLLGPALELDWPDNAVTAGLRGFVRASRTADALVQVLARSGAPVVAVDDAQWLDDLSVGLIDALSRRGALLLLTVRSDSPPEGDLARLVARGEVVGLPPLSREAVAELVCARLGSPACPDPLSGWLRAQASGHPYFTLALLDMVRQRGVLSQDDAGAVVFFDQVALAAFEAPPTVEAALATRFDRLPAEASSVLRIAGCLGARVDVGALRAGCAAEGVQEVDAAVDLLVDAELLVRAGDGLRFVSQTVQQTAHGLLVRDQRRRIHEVMARAFERREACPPATLAWHWSHTDQDGPAFDALEVAHQDALDQGLLRAAGRFARRALARDRDVRDTGGAGLPALARARWHYRAGLACRSSGDSETAFRHLDQAAQLLDLPRPASVWGWRWLALRGVLGWLLPDALKPRPDVDRVGVQAGVLSLLSLCAYLRQSPPEQLIARALQAVDLAGRSAKAVPAGVAHSMVGVALSGWPTAARDVLTRGQRQAAELDDPRERLDAALGVLMLDLAHARWDAADALADDVLPAVNASGGEHLRGVFLGLLGCIDWCRGRVDRVESRATEMQRAADEQGYPHPRGWGRNLDGLVALARGEPERALRMADEAERLLGPLGDAGRDTATSVQAQALARLGRAEECVARCERLLAALGQGGPIPMTSLEAYAGVADAALTLREAGLEAPPDLVRRGVDLTRRFADRHVIGRPRLELQRGRALALEGDAAGARRRLEGAVEQAHRLGMAMEAATGRARLARIG